MTKRIAFIMLILMFAGNQSSAQQHRDGTPGKLYVMNADGSNVTQITNAHGFFARWSAKNKIAVINGRWPVSDIYLMNGDGSNQTQLTK